MAKDYKMLWTTKVAALNRLGLWVMLMLIWQSSCVSIFCRVGNERLIPHVYYIYTVYMIDKSSILLGQSIFQSFGQ
jgi:hypothetical protein